MTQVTGADREDWRTSRDKPVIEQRHKDAAAWAMDRAPDSLTWEMATASHVTPDRIWQMNRVAEAMARMERDAIARHRNQSSSEVETTAALLAEVERLREALGNVRAWIASLTVTDMNEIVADGGITAGMVVGQEAIEQVRRIDAALKTDHGGTQS